MTGHVAEQEPDVTPARRPWRRRLTVHVHGGWREALRESAVILLSVTAALAGQAWWQGRQDRQRELGYLSELLADTRGNEQMLDSAIRKDSSYAVAGVKLVRALQARDPLPRGDTVLRWISAIGSSSDYQPLTGTLRAIMGTGDLRMIRNDSLRALIAAYDGVLEADGQDIRALLALQLQQVVPLARAAPFMQAAYSGPLAASRADLERLQGNLEFGAIVMAFQTSNANRLTSLREIRRETGRLARALEKEPGVRRPPAGAGRLRAQ